MMRNHLVSFIVFLFFLLGQGGLPEVQASTSYFSAAQQERIFLHHDRDIYVAGEHVFFKMQVTTPLSSPESTSRIAYLVLRNARSSNVLEMSVQLDAKGAWSAFALPDTLSTGHYELVAFTNYMRNFGEEHFFRKQLFIANRFDSEVALIERFNEGYQSMPLTFFPEGGQLIPGVSSKVAVVSGNSGIRAGESAWLTNAQQDTLQHLTIADPDFFVFTFIPEAEGSYALVAQDGSRFSLPTAARQGSGISLSRQAGQLDIQLHPSFDEPGTYSLEVHSPEQSIQLRMISLHRQALRLSFAGDELPDGILNFLVKDEKGDIICQRMWYNQPLGQSSLEVELMGSQPAAREQVPFRITARELNRVPVSVAVVQRALCFDHQQKILNLLLLNPNTLSDYQQLAGQAAAGRMQNAFNDLLLMAAPENQPLEQQQEQDSHIYAREMQGFNLSGKLAKGLTHQGIADAVIYLSSPDTLLNFNYAITQEDGSFYFLLDDYYHGKEMILQVADKQLASTSRIQVFDRFVLKQPFRPVVFAQVNDHLDAIVSLQKIVAVQKHYGMHAEVVSHSSDLPLMVPQPLFHKANQVIVPSEYVALDNFREIAREIIYSLRVRSNAEGSYSAALVNERERSYFKQAPLFFVDAVPVPDISQIMDLSSDDLLRIDVHNIPWIYGDLSFDGIISMVSKNRKYQQLEFPASAARIQAPVYAPRLVLQQKAHQGASSGSAIPDFRPLLAWEPALTIARQQSLEHAFVCGDLKGEYMIVVNGINQQGVPVGDFFYFEVK